MTPKKKIDVEIDEPSADDLEDAYRAGFEDGSDWEAGDDLEDDYDD